MKTKINALALYMASDEVKNGFFTKDLNLRDEIQEKIEFLEKNSGKDIIIKGYDEENVKISKYDNSTSYTFPLYILDHEEEVEEKEEEVEEKKNFKNIKFDNLIKPILIFLFIFLIIFGINNGFLEKKQTLAVETPVKSPFTILTEKANNNRLEISKELELQKELRKQIKESTERVKKKEKENNDLRNQLILLANS